MQARAGIGFTLVAIVLAGGLVAAGAPAATAAVADTDTHREAMSPADQVGKPATPRSQSEATNTPAPPKTEKAPQTPNRSEAPHPRETVPHTKDPTQELKPIPPEGLRELRRRIIRNLRPINRTRNLA